MSEREVARKLDLFKIGGRLNTVVEAMALGEPSVPDWAPEVYSAGYLSHILSGRRRGNPDALYFISKIAEIPMDLLFLYCVRQRQRFSRKITSVTPSRDIRKARALKGARPLSTPAA